MQTHAILDDSILFVYALFFVPVLRPFSVGFGGAGLCGSGLWALLDFQTLGFWGLGLWAVNLRTPNP